MLLLCLAVHIQCRCDPRLMMCLLSICPCSGVVTKNGVLVDYSCSAVIFTIYGVQIPTHSLLHKLN